MIVSAVFADAASWLGGSFEGDRCDCCGCVDKLEYFRMETRYGGKIVFREARLCRKCMRKTEAGVYESLGKNIVQ
ncbi:hypothetical protein [Desulfovibrio gilichinskyi]|uniref:Uncharacterized protein n=1 Tax=Desulfovibrio gilichinskyi TaxID=1519643 RepID=A0A1X7C1M3_9BACT|nr:hypothetical protein [Desulfovibrio gilichinskyi]SME88337.1 hypothetical protein SAMN06295933_0143 [Desulfovibrio gilichinskyi]